VSEGSPQRWPRWVTKFGWVTYIYTMPQMSRNHKMLNYDVSIPIHICGIRKYHSDFDKYRYLSCIPTYFINYNMLSPNVPGQFFLVLCEGNSFFVMNIFHGKSVDDYTPLPSFMEWYLDTLLSFVLNVAIQTEIKHFKL